MGRIPVVSDVWFFKKSDWPEMIVAFRKLLWVLGGPEGSIRPGQQRVTIHLTAFQEATWCTSLSEPAVL